MGAPRWSPRAWADVALIVVFVSFIGVPLVGKLIGPAHEEPIAENRAPAPLPPLEWKEKTLKEFPARFEAYYDDHFGGRRFLIDFLNKAKVRWLHVSSSPSVVLGKSGFLYYTIDPVGHDYNTVRPFTDDELARWQRLLEERRDWLEAHGIPYVFVIAPDKQTIYPECLPRALKPRTLGPSRLDQLVAYLHEHSDFQIVDLRGPLMRGKAAERLFSLTDSHWNDNGAYLAYRAILNAVAKQGFDVKPWPRSAFRDSPYHSTGGDLARMLGLGKRYHEDYLCLWPRIPRRAKPVDPGFHIPNLPPEMQPLLVEGPDENLPHAVIFRDSFANYLIPFLSEHFSHVLYLWKEFYEFDYEAIEREKPAIVIQEIVERKLLPGFPTGSTVGLEKPSTRAAMTHTGAWHALSHPKGVQKQPDHG